VLDLDCGSDFDPNRDEDFFAALPSHPAVYLIEMQAPGAQPYLSRTVDLRRAAERLLHRPEALSKRLNLRDVAARIRFRLTGSRFEQSLALYQQARIHFPKRYRDFLRLRPPAVVKINLRNAYPRCYVTRRISPDEGLYVGPFASRRAAEFFADGFRDLFKVRRCQIKIRRDSQFPGCIYSEMKMCLAPCFAGCSDAEYAAEVSRSTEALATLGASLETSLQQEREAASESLDFERAASLHKKLEKVSDVMKSFPDLARRVDQLDAVILQRTAEENTIAFFAVHHGIIADPFLVRFDELSSQPRSVEAIIRSHLEANSSAGGAAGAEPAPSFEASDLQTAQSATPSATMPSATDLKVQFGIRFVPEELPEHLSLLARWFYAKPREGEIFFRDPTWPYRRLLRACARILAPPAAPPPPASST
jgi:excinuclease UvrABC nuclease subunit